MKLKKIGLVLLVVIAFAGCSAGPKVTVEEAEKAFIAGFVVVFTVSFEAAMGNTIEGVTLSEDGNDLTFENYPLGEFPQLGYTKVSGSVTGEEGAKVVDLKFEGGPVKTLKYEIGEALDMSHVQMTVVANGSEIDIDITEADFDALEGS